MHNVHYYTIKVTDKLGGNLVEFLIWSGLKWELRLKYDWYFKYRSALLQVKFPKYIVVSHWGNEPATGKTLDQIKEQKRRSKKSQITKFKNQLLKAKENWTSLFPIEDDQFYKKALHKISQLEYKLQSL